MIWLVGLAGFAFLAAGTAVAYAVGAASVLTFFATDNARYLPILPQRVFSQIDVFALMAMPLFILAGEIMNRAGITRALVDLSMSLLGRLKGGLGYVNILTSVFFAGISGSAVADAAALSNTLVPAMRAQGYSPLYAGAITAAASVIGPIIPPSLVMIFYGAIMQTSVAAMFIGGIVPGLLLAVALAFANVYFAHRDDHPGGRTAETPRLMPALRHAAPSLSLPVIILGGIVFGVVTPTEAAALAVLAAIAVGLYYGGLTLGGLREGIEQTASLTGAIFMILSAVACFGWLAGNDAAAAETGGAGRRSRPRQAALPPADQRDLHRLGHVPRRAGGDGAARAALGAGRGRQRRRPGASRHCHLAQPHDRSRDAADRRLASGRVGGDEDRLLGAGARDATLRR